jgi:LysM repeat protein
MKSLCWLIIAGFITLTAAAQEKLVIMGTAPNLYVVHTVGEGESIQTISNQFGQSVTKLLTYNGMKATGPLAKGTEVKIPLTQYNLIRVKGDENSAPVYHIVQKGENLYRLGKENGVAIPMLKEWNKLNSDVLKDGQALIIGYMVNAKLPAPKNEVPAKEITAGETIKTEPALPTSTVKNASKKEPAATPVPKITSPAAGQPVTIISKEPVIEPKKKTETGEYVPREGDEGYFAAPYAQHAKRAEQQFHSGDAATFKTISGWTDRKYYVLINDIAPETIVRITAPNNKSICAKVLGPLQETKGASGLLLRMSNSAASTLGITDPKFTVTVTYFE